MRWGYSYRVKSHFQHSSGVVLSSTRKSPKLPECLKWHTRWTPFQSCFWSFVIDFTCPAKYIESHGLMTFFTDEFECCRASSSPFVPILNPFTTMNDSSARWMMMAGDHTKRARRGKKGKWKSFAMWNAALTHFFHQMMIACWVCIGNHPTLRWEGKTRL